MKKKVQINQDVKHILRHVKNFRKTSTKNACFNWMNKNSMNLTENLIKFHFILMEKMGEYSRDIFFIEILIVNAYLA